MTAADAENLMNQLKNGEINECHVSKEHFLIFQRELVKREDFKHFRGIAQRGGSVIYHYMAEPRS
ncbi:hypothetical protein [Pseudobacillus wudalianchiensis]|uniref:Abortive phage infection protein n=1 Tax=Pseudobacillus wudalianchiensis TaxID=1743143 RepID=A0A1B9AT47_9BACI|nr:hypothetical protein [Bacillus wudalianchiensis]OCA87062.1 hypothetical protein A8F95_07240 [Bacillus wudalianchiensis]